MLLPPSDEDWQAVTNQKNIDKARREADKKYGSKSATEIDYLRKMCAEDAYFLGYGILGYTRLSPKLHGNLFSWLQRSRSEQYRLILEPRSHFKTTCATVIDSVQATLPNPEAPWPYNLGTNVRILLGHESHEGSSRFLYEITRHYTSNPAFMGLFPELVPSSRIQRMNKLELELPRSERWAEPTFDTIGVGGHSQGRHYNLIKLDDIFGDKARDSKAERETLLQWFDNIQSFFIRLKYDHLDLIGTRWSLDDVYAHAIKQYGKKMLKYIRRIKEKNAEGELEFIFPEEFDDAAVEILRKNAKVWAAQYVNDPHEGLAEFNPAWKRYYYWTAKDRISAFTGVSTTAPMTINTKELDILIFVDPATTGKRGIVVTGTDSKGRVFVLDTIKTPSVKIEEQAPEIFRLVRKWWPRAVVIEKVLFSALYKVWFEAEMKLRGLRFNIIQAEPKKISSTLDKSKFGRVRALSQWFSAGQIFFNEGQAELIEEFDNFGATDDYHLLDALAYGPDNWRHGVTKVEQDKRAEEEKQVIEGRDVQTGYSI